jgi:hypothetical protein
MLIFRLILAILLVGIGISIVVRMASLGIHPEIVPGVILGAAMIALGVHRIALIRRIAR